MTIELRRASHRFADGRGIRDVQLSVGAGEIVGLLGPNGAGKSTTLRLLLGLLPGDAEVRIDGADPRAGDMARRLGSVADGRGLDPGWTVRAYLRLVAVARRLEPRATVAAAVIEHRLESIASSRIGTLSLGQTRRVALCGALLGDPPNLVLDEPFSGIDAETLPDIRRRIARVASAGGSVLVTSHQLAHLEPLVHRVVVLADGRVVADATAAAFLAGRGAGYVRVEANPVLAPALCRAGADVDAESVRDGTLRCKGISRHEIARVAAAEGVLVTELVEVVPTLEEVYLATIGQAERAARAERPDERDERDERDEATA